MPELQAAHPVGRTMRKLQAGAAGPSTTQAPMTRPLLRPAVTASAQYEASPDAWTASLTRTEPSGHADPTSTTTPRNESAGAGSSPTTAPWSVTGAQAGGGTPPHTRRPTPPPRPRVPTRRPTDGRLVVRCRSCNAARSAHLAARVLTAMQVNDPCPAERPITHRGGDDPVPVAA